MCGVQVGPPRLGQGNQATSPGLGWHKATSPGQGRSLDRTCMSSSGSKILHLSSGQRAYLSLLKMYIDGRLHNILYHFCVLNDTITIGM